MSNSKPLQIALVDDHPMILEGLKSLLQENKNYQIYAFSKGAAVLDFIQENKVDLVLLDIVLNDGSGLDFCHLIKQKAPSTRVVAISNQAERSIIFRFLENGGNGYILKNADAPEILSCVEQALVGELSLSREVKEIMLRSSSEQQHKPLPRLTKREHQILSAIANGETSAAIAEKLFVSLITIETHRRNLLQKFQAKNMVELVRIAVEHKVI